MVAPVRAGACLTASMDHHLGPQDHILYLRNIFGHDASSDCGKQPRKSADSTRPSLGAICFGNTEQENLYFVPQSARDTDKRHVVGTSGLLDRKILYYYRR